MSQNVREQEEIVEVWGPIICRAIRHYGIVGTDAEDLAQTIICQVLEKGYDQIYDSSKSQLNTFIFAMVKKRAYRFMARNGKDALRHSKLAGDDLWLLGGDKQAHDPMEEVISHEFWALVAKVRVELEKLPRRRSLVKDGKIIPRSVTDIFDKLVLQYSQAEIAREMGYSEGTISLLVKGLRSHPAVQSLLTF